MAVAEEVDNGEKMNKKKDNKKNYQNKIALVLIIIAIISIILSFIIYLYIIPICVLGIIISLILIKRSKIFYFIIVIYLLCLVLSIVLFIFIKPSSNHNIVGTWNCSSYNQKELIIKIKIDNNNKFIWSKYKDNNQNYIIGEYKIKNIDKKDNNKNVYYYNFVLDSNNFIQNGKEKNDQYHKEYDIAINKKEAKMVLASDDNMILKCNKISSENPVIE